jgi:hypothetical protein
MAGAHTHAQKCFFGKQHLEVDFWRSQSTIRVGRGLVSTHNNTSFGKTTPRALHAPALLCREGTERHDAMPPRLLKHRTYHIKRL